MSLVGDTLQWRLDFCCGEVHIGRPCTRLLEASLCLWLVALGFRSPENSKDLASRFQNGVVSPLYRT